MSLFWLDGFDTYNSNADIQRNYEQAQANPSPTTVNPRTGTRALRTAVGDAFAKVIPASNVWYAGIALRPDTTNCATIFAFRNGAAGALTGIQVVQNTLTINILINGVVTFTTPIPEIVAATYTYLEIMSNNNNNTFELRINNFKIYTLTGLANMVRDRVYIQIAPGTGGAGQVDDFYIHSSQFLGPQRCYSLFVDADELPQDWTRSGGANAWSLLNAPNWVAGNYIEADVAPKISRFGIQNLPVGNLLVNGARITSIQNITTAGVAQTQQRLIIGGAVFGNSVKSIGATAGSYNDIFDLSATPAEINSASLEIEKIV